VSIGLKRATLVAVAGLLAWSVVMRARADAYVWSLPPGFPAPFVPRDNPMSTEKVALGRRLFYDTRLSANGTQSCATCHQQSRAFTDGRPVSIGSTGEPHPRGSMSLANVVYAAALNWADSRTTRLEDQALGPMHNERPIELGLARDDRWLDRLRTDVTYPALFRAAYPDEDEPVSSENVRKAIASFERTLISGRSPYDRYHFDRDDSAVSAAARRGEVLFHSQELSCFTCHRGFNFSGATVSARRPDASIEFHNTGLYNLAGAFSYPSRNLGLYEVTRDQRDVGKFKAPTLRNVAVTAPYMHDGSVATLEDAIAHYAAGGRTIASGPFAGIGRDNPLKSPAIRGFPLTERARADLVAFLESLTDEEFLKDQRFAEPD
jgi:cytochrome c peroxidase